MRAVPNVTLARMTSLPLASLRRRLASLLYDGMLLLALWFVAGFLVVGVFPEPPKGSGRIAFQAYLLLVTGVYLVWFWRRGGQTLAMKTWRIRLVGIQGQPISLRQAWLRFVLAAVGSAAFGAGYVWAMLDREGQFLHDRIAGTRLVMSAPFDVPKTRGRDQAEDNQGQESADDRRPLV